MKTKLFIVLFATVIGAVITGCNHQPEENNGGASATNNATSMPNTNSMGTVNTPTITSSNNVPMTNGH